MDWFRTLNQLFHLLSATGVGLVLFGWLTLPSAAQATAEPQAHPTRLIEFHSSDSQPAPTGAVRGEVVAEFEGGRILLLTEDGQLWTLDKDAIVSSAPCDTSFTPLTPDQIYEQFQQQLPGGFSVYKTRHYVLIYNTSEVYVKWVAELFEHLYRGFYNYWRSKGFRITEPRFPLVAVVFSNRPSYLVYAEREIGESAQAMIGYYNMKTNRIVTYDMTGVDGVVPRGTRVASTAVIQQILSQPQAERTVATMIHEAVHQLAYNSGLQVRLADNPLWLSEGIAMFFETPDAYSPKGWGAIGKINPHNMRLFAQYVPQRPADSLLTLISQDQRLRDAETSSQAYPESWALTYYLMTLKNKQFVAYLKELADQPPLAGESSDRERIELFKKHFGADLTELDKDFINFYRRM